jgi:UDP-glucose 4-epimerase
MKVIIAGQHSYVGTHVHEWLSEKHGWDVSEIDMISDSWKHQVDLFRGVDAVIHVAAIVHRPKEEITWEEYHKVNTLLPLEVAQKAKNHGVRHFIFISTMGVYKGEKKLPTSFVISSNTPLESTSHYGRSKLEAEERLKQLRSDDFKVSIVRPPNIYGVGCPGNYIRKFVQLADMLPVFPDAFTQSRQGFLYIDNLSELLYQILATETTGCFTPQDDAGISTVELLRLIARVRHRKVHFSKLLGWGVSGLSWLPIVKKLYGGIAFAPEILDQHNLKYHVVSFKEGMGLTVKAFNS